MKLFVGIDVSSQELEACFMNSDGDKVEALKVKNDLHGASHLRDRIVAVADKLSSSEIHIGLEATSVYSWHPAMYMHEDAALKGQSVYHQREAGQQVQRSISGYGQDRSPRRLDHCRPSALRQTDDDHRDAGTIRCLAATYPYAISYGPQPDT